MTVNFMQIKVKLIIMLKLIWFRFKKRIKLIWKRYLNQIINIFQNKIYLEYWNQIETIQT